MNKITKKILLEDLEVKSLWYQIKVLKGFYFDGASIPAW